MGYDANSRGVAFVGGRQSSYQGRIKKVSERGGRGSTAGQKRGPDKEQPRLGRGLGNKNGAMRKKGRAL